MEEKKGQQHHHVSPQGSPPGAFLDNEFNLLDLWRVLVRQWKVIGAITGLSVLGAVAYVLLATPVYEAQAVVRPPETQYVEALNIPGINQSSDISKITGTDIFAKFTRNLKSSSLREQFFAENPQFSSLHQQFVGKRPQFLRDNVPKVKEGVKHELGFVFVSLQGSDSKLVADWLNGFIQLAERATNDDLYTGVETKIDNQKKEIQNQLKAGRDFEVRRRLDRITLLEDQIAIARALKIFDRSLSGHDALVGRQSVGVALNTVQEPLYRRGVKELTAEKEELEKRKNDEPYIAGFRDKQERLAQLDAGLKQLQAARAIAHAVTVDQSAIETKSPVKPKRMLVLALSLVMGGMLGIFSAFVVNLIEQQKKGQ